MMMSKSADSVRRVATASVSGDISPRSNPEQNARPLPRNVITRTCGLPSASSSARCNSPTIAALIALSLSGRFNLMCAIGPSMISSMQSNGTGLLATLMLRHDQTVHGERTARAHQHRIQIQLRDVAAQVVRELTELHEGLYQRLKIAGWGAAHAVQDFREPQS